VGYKLTGPAQADLEQIWRYIARDNIQAANKVSEKFEEYFRLIGDKPHIGHKREDLTNKNLKFISVYSYMIAYKAETEPVQIIRILSGYRDIASLL
jgi:plasmid stabilization system protein ParE